MALFTSIILVVALLSWCVVSYLASPLRSIPGPFLAKFTNLWRLYDHYKGTQILTQRRLHETLGPAVRIGPNIISLSDPSYIKIIYGTNGKFRKSDFYAVNDAVQGGQVIENIFGTRSNAFHAKHLRPIQYLYSMSYTLARVEPLMDKAIETMCMELEKRFVGESLRPICDISDWIGYVAWDIVGETTFSHDIGFLKAGRDVGRMIHIAQNAMRYFGIVGQMPALDRLLGKNPWCPFEFPTFSRTANLAFRRMTERTREPQNGESGHQDFLDSFLETKTNNPGIIGDKEVVGYLMINMLAGADTTGIVLKAILYYLLKTPHVLKELHRELDNAKLSFPAKYEETKDLPFLKAVVKEGLRMHPPVGTILERVVPSSTLELPNQLQVPPGTIVGINPWIIARNKDVFGQDADEFRPNRWLPSAEEDEGAFLLRLSKMKEAEFSFGAGNRVCTGRHFASVELFKVIATLISRFDMQPEAPDQQWTLHMWWFVFIDNIRVRLSLRTPDL